MEATPDFATVVWRGVEYRFTPMQAKVIRMLFKFPGKALLQDSILKEAESDCCRLRDIFKLPGATLHPAWGIMVKRGERKGTYQVPREYPESTPENELIMQCISSNETGVVPVKSEKGDGNMSNVQTNVRSAVSGKIERCLREFYFALAERHLLRAFVTLIRCGSLAGTIPEADWPQEFRDRQGLFDELRRELELANGDTGVGLADFEHVLQQMAVEMYPTDQMESTSPHIARAARFGDLRFGLREEAIQMADARAKEIFRKFEFIALPKEEQERRRAEEKRRHDWQNSCDEEFNRGISGKD